MPNIGNTKYVALNKVRQWFDWIPHNRTFIECLTCAGTILCITFLVHLLAYNKTNEVNTTIKYFPVLSETQRCYRWSKLQISSSTAKSGLNLNNLVADQTITSMLCWTIHIYLFPLEKMLRFVFYKKWMLARYDVFRVLMI